MATKIFVYWSDRLWGRAFDHHSGNGGTRYLPIKIASWAGHLTKFLKFPGFVWGFAREDARALNGIAHNRRKT